MDTLEAMFSGCCSDCWLPDPDWAHSVNAARGACVNTDCVCHVVERIKKLTEKDCQNPDCFTHHKKEE